jgi:hypothetical protein
MVSKAAIAGSNLSPVNSTIPKLGTKKPPASRIVIEAPQATSISLETNGISPALWIGKRKLIN